MKVARLLTVPTRKFRVYYSDQSEPEGMRDFLHKFYSGAESVSVIYHFSKIAFIQPPNWCRGSHTSLSSKDGRGDPGSSPGFGIIFFYFSLPQLFFAQLALRLDGFFIYMKGFVRPCGNIPGRGFGRTMTRWG